MITLKNVTKSFNGNSIVRGIDLSVSEGERIAIIGPSGCGKSTLLRLLMGLQQTDTGQVWIDNEDITQMDIKQLRRMRTKFGMLFQHAALFDSMTVGENVAFPLREILHLPEAEIQARVKDKLLWVEMSGKEHRMPSELSGGQQKRVGLARAIACDPKIILYDEPTTGLDPILSTNIEDLIVKLNKESHTTSIIVTHQISTILRTADKIYLMRDGVLLPPETPESIQESQNPYIKEFISGGLAS
ncbi:MAG: ABC transporter ATP-binding protein [Candidatus Margulisbacteria bacterium]|nr:ABC transporter ATP-binding protein [Candidatus Margulisiibacteriota bacterium]